MAGDLVSGLHKWSGESYQLPLPAPFFLVFLGSASAKPCLAKKRGRCSVGEAVPSAIPAWSLSLNLWERVTTGKRGELSSEY